MHKIRRKLSSIKWYITVARNSIVDRLSSKSKALASFDTSIQSDNMGDAIICQFCNELFQELFNEQGYLRIPTHVEPDTETVMNLPHYRHKIVCGTNLITPHFEWYSNWKMPSDLYGYFNILTLAVGWGCYCDDISRKSKWMYNAILSHKGLHSVRDRYTEKKFHEMGIHNVVYTGCVTLWDLTPTKCKNIPLKKADKVISTITDYSRDIEADREMLNILFDHYEEVMVWIQGEHDMEYLSELVDISKITIIDRNLDAFQTVLSAGNIDYIGTRLHAGIYALNHGVRSIIIAIDNRAKEMGKDVNLPMVQRESIQTELPHLIEKEMETKLNIPWENIKRWKEQFFKTYK